MVSDSSRPRDRLAYAEEDLQAAEAALAAATALDRHVYFHCQQAVEKALKGFLVAHGRVVRKVHDIRHIGTGCVEVDTSLRSLIESVDFLTPDGTIARYLGDIPDAAPEDPRGALRLARGLVCAIVQRLGT